jgi:streptomycin 6-kinase
MMEASPDTSGYATAEEWAAGFDRHLASGDGRIPAAFVEEARDRYMNLARTQASVRLLHGDLQHYNILFDAERGWVAIDPKGVVAEAEFELAAALRNPHDMPELYGMRAIERRVGHVVDTLRLDGERVLAWTFAQAVLSAIWTIEDERELDPAAPAMLVARAAHSLLG